MLFYPVRVHGLQAARAARRSRDLLPRSIQQIPGVMQGGVGWQGIIPSRAAKMGVDRGRQGDRQGRQRGATSTSSSSPRRSPSTSLASLARRHPRPGRADHGARAPAALARPAAPRARGRARARPASSCRRSSATVTDEIGSNIDQLLDVKLMVIRHIEEQPGAGATGSSSRSAQGAALHHQLRLRVRVRCSASPSRSSPSAVPHWWVLPICGVDRRLRHQLAGDQDDLRAGRAAEVRALHVPGPVPAPPARGRRRLRGDHRRRHRHARATSARSCCTGRARTARVR